MTVFDNAPAPLGEYYRILTAGIDAYADGEELLPILDAKLDFEGPIAGRLAGAARFLVGVRGFIANVKSISPIHLVADSGHAATLYDAELPGGTVRFSEFFVIQDGSIRELRIQYDPADYTAKGGR
ncbi:hypothetical protein [Xylanimonas sp. McL0601]|uniref:hypothetical protein n=1 Tax=Xylanimonas sp. McL0601 TaxID=3414739 RepID=UPI003CE67872